MRVGQFELDLPVTQARSYNLSPYDIYQQANIGAMNSLVSLQQNVSNQFTFASAAKGIELSGGHQYGGYHYSVAVFDQNTGRHRPVRPTPVHLCAVRDRGRQWRRRLRLEFRLQEHLRRASLTVSISSAIPKAGTPCRQPERRARATTPT